MTAERAAAAYVALWVLMALVAGVDACRPPSTPTPAEAASEVQYVVELQACLDKGKAEHSRAVYAACAAGVDARYADGGAK